MYLCIHTGPDQTLLDRSPGLAVIVNCVYEACGDLCTLLGTKVDADEMKKTCVALNYVIKQVVNPTKEQLEGLLQDVSSTLGTYHMKREVAKEKVIIFAFSGHGTSKGTAEKLYANDGQMLDLKEEIIRPFTKHKGVSDVPKLFLIDACRGAQHLTKGSGGGGGEEVVQKADEEVYFEKGVEHVRGNYRIDYSTIPSHVSYVSPSSGSMWMPKLARALRTQNDSYQNITANVKEEVHLHLSEEHRQMCESVSRLTVGPLYLRKRPQHPAGGNNPARVGEIGKKKGGITIMKEEWMSLQCMVCMYSQLNQHVYTQFMTVYTQPFYTVILSLSGPIFPVIVTQQARSKGGFEGFD